MINRMALMIGGAVVLFGAGIATTTVHISRESEARKRAVNEGKDFTRDSLLNAAKVDAIATHQKEAVLLDSVKHLDRVVTQYSSQLRNTSARANDLAATVDSQAQRLRRIANPTGNTTIGVLLDSLVRNSGTLKDSVSLLNRSVKLLDDSLHARTLAEATRRLEAEKLSQDWSVEKVALQNQVALEHAKRLTVKKATFIGGATYAVLRGAEWAAKKYLKKR